MLAVEEVCRAANGTDRLVSYGPGPVPSPPPDPRGNAPRAVDFPSRIHRVAGQKLEEQPATASVRLPGEEGTSNALPSHPAGGSPAQGRRRRGASPAAADSDLPPADHH